MNTEMSISLKLRGVQVLQEERTEVEIVNFNLGCCPAEICDCLLTVTSEIHGFVIFFLLEAFL